LIAIRKLLIGASVAAIAAALGMQGAGAALANPAAGPTVCSGKLAPGTYRGLIVKGACLVRKGPVTIQGTVIVTRKSIFDAVSTARLTVDGRISVRAGALVGLGCSPEVGCKKLTPDSFYGGIRATNPLDLIIQSGTIYGNVSVTGGGGGRNCKNNKLLKSPNFSTVEDTVVHGNVSFTNMRTCWFGLIRDHIHGNVIIRGNKFADPDANEDVTNIVYGNVTCANNAPGPHIGDSKGKPNKVYGKRRCPHLP
jgi:hypothetical protein